MVNLIDVHCHLTFDRFSEDLDEVIERAKKAGLKLIITSGVNPKTNRDALKLSKKYKGLVYPSFGIYPVDAVASFLKNINDDVVREIEVFDVDEELKWIEENKDSMLAIGEVGLDYKMVEDEKAREEQRNIFRKIIRFAKRIDKPLVIHSRNAEADVVNILEEEKFNKVDMHCFSARKSVIKKAIDLGFYFSIPPVLTRLEHFKMLALMVPINQILTETDAPYLSPEAGTRNEPSNVPITIKEIAKIKNISEEEAAKIIFNNAKNLFKL